MEQFYQTFLQFIDQWGYWAIIVLMAMESACLPVPSELTLGFAGYMVWAGRLDFALAAAAGVAGGLLGSAVAYAVGRRGGRAFIDRYGKYVFLSKSHVDAAQRWFDRYGLKAAFYSRLLPVVRTFISLPAGFARVPFKKFAIYTILGSIPWTIALIYGGALLGKHWYLLEQAGHKLSLAFAAALLAAGAVWFCRQRGKTRPPSKKGRIAP